ncbi:MAG: DUF1295 domain-containing protein [Candidatus Hydrogenedentes bacterium]|nr:DUF1295 domain-containing protein [Candidatus Hydrogenedentota bacterium]
MNPGEQLFFNALLVSSFVVAGLVFVVLFAISAPYGRHGRAGWGPSVSNRLGWLLMETPAVLTIAVCFWLGAGPGASAALVLVVLWEIHYVHRAWIYPFRLPKEGRPMPVFVVGMALLFNLSNGYLNGRYLGLHSEDYPTAWLTEPRFLIGVTLFFVGFGINLHADRILLKLRRPGDNGYAIPHGGLFRWISCPNYLGECLEWVGWAIAAWSLPGLLFAVWTAANLVPRALAHHRWYRTTFPDYPPERRAIVPYLF